LVVQLNSHELILITCRYPCKWVRVQCAQLGIFLVLLIEHDVGDDICAVKNFDLECYCELKMGSQTVSFPC
jgi:hypothetical protein